MLPIVSIPASIEEALRSYRTIFSREEGFAWVSRYLTGLLVSPNKTVQGIYDLLVWPDSEHAPSRRAMHASLFETGWSSDALIGHHRQEVGHLYRAGGRSGLSLDWTFSHHDRGPEIYGIKKQYDYVEHRSSLYQTLLTVVVSNRERIDGLEVVVQSPGFEKEEKAYLNATVKESYASKEEVRKRLSELLAHMQHTKAYKKRSEIFLEVVRRIEQEGHFPSSPYVFDNGVLSPKLTQEIEARGKYWLSELEKSRLIFWDNRYHRIEEVALELRQSHPESFRKVTVKERNGQVKTFGVFTKCVRLKRTGKKRIFIVHEKEDLSDPPRFFVTNALHWEAKRALETWSYRWASETFHEFDKQYAGLEAAQLRNEEAVKKHFRLSCVAQSLLQSIVAQPSTSEKFAFAQGAITSGQRWRTMLRELFSAILAFVKHLFEKGLSNEQVLERLMPA